MRCMLELFAFFFFLQFSCKSKLLQNKTVYFENRHDPRNLNMDSTCTEHLLYVQYWQTQQGTRQIGNTCSAGAPCAGEICILAVNYFPFFGGGVGHSLSILYFMYCLDFCLKSTVILPAE